MAYYLTIKEKNNYKLLDITSLEEFQRKSKYKNNLYSLEEIDNFTMNFDNELSLKRKLYNKGVISAEDITKDITIRRKNKDNLEKVMFGLIYKNMAKYLDEYYLRIKLLELQNDSNFLNKLLNHYRNTYNQGNIAAIRNILLGNNDEQDIFEALSNFYKDEVYTLVHQTGELKLKYKSFHDLGMFIYNYQNTKNDVDIALKELERKKELHAMKETLIPNVVKKKIKKREELEGQTSFF